MKSLLEKLEEEYKRVDADCGFAHDTARNYLENCDLRDTLKEALDYIRRPAK